MLSIVVKAVAGIRNQQIDVPGLADVLLELGKLAIGLLDGKTFRWLEAHRVTKYFARKIPRPYPFTKPIRHRKLLKLFFPLGSSFKESNDGLLVTVGGVLQTVAKLLGTVLQ